MLNLIWVTEALNRHQKGPNMVLNGKYERELQTEPLSLVCIFFVCFFFKKDLVEPTKYLEKKLDIKYYIGFMKWIIFLIALLK